MSAIEPSGTTGSDAERRAALALADELRAEGREVRVLPLWVHTAWWAPQALAAALGVAGSIVAVATPLPGLLLALAGLAIALTELTPLHPLRRLTIRRATQNVVGAPSAIADDAVTLVLTAAVDRERRGLARRLPGGILRWSIASLSLVAGCAAARLADVDGDWLGIVQLPPTLVLLLCTLALLDQAVADPPDGDRAAVDTVIRVSAALDARPPSRLAVAVVLAGAGGARSAGLRAWLRARKRRGIDSGRVALLHLEPTPGDPPSWWTHDGDLVASALHPQLVTAARSAAAAEPALGALPRRRPLGTAAGRARGAGWPALAIGAGDADSAAAFTLALVAALDEDMARNSPAAAGGD
jgi:hypothetical protein